MSPIFFFFFFNIFDDLSQEMHHLFMSLFAADSAIMVECHKISEINAQLTTSLSFLHTWSERNHAQFSIKKYVSILFSRGSSKTPISDFMSGQQLKDISRNGHRYLVVHLDAQLTIRLHIFKLCATVKSLFRFLCMLTNWNQGTDRKTLKIPWSMYLMGKNDYGDIIYDLVSTSTNLAWIRLSVARF